MTRDAVLQGFSHFNIKPNLLLLMVTNVSWHTSKCWLINLLVRAKIHLYNYVIFFSNFHLQFHLGKKIHKLLFFLFFPSLQKKKKKAVEWSCCQTKADWLFLCLFHLFFKHWFQTLSACFTLFDSVSNPRILFNNYWCPYSAPMTIPKC